LDTLKQILNGGFKPFYSSEDLTMFGVRECPGIPMVSFCDIPLSQTNQHVTHYGRYALGLTKEWGKDRNVVPIHYIYENSICANILSDIYDSLPKADFYTDCTCMKFDTRTAIFFYGKPYTGELLKRDRDTGKILDKGTVTFYDEREWRYVPFADQSIKEMREIPSGVRTMLSQREYETGEVFARASTILQEHYTLKFGAEHIKYLIVNKQEEIPELIDCIDGLWPQAPNEELGSCTSKEKKQLMARVMSMDWIEQDF
jgi:hypothetical protein